ALVGGPRRGSGCQCRRGYHLGAEGSEAGFGQLGSPGGGGGPGRGAGAAASPPRAGAAPEGAERAQRRRRHGFRGQRARPAAPGGAAQAGGRRGADEGTENTVPLVGKVSQAAAELQQYCMQNACKDALLVGVPAGSNPFREPRSCALL
uniref:Guanine nucleotide-binding protein subunit gamma n=1 Tax=Equus asinus TaxID=9793 RepID=A0A9L0K7A5_EQUAS